MIIHSRLLAPNWRAAVRLVVALCCWSIGLSPAVAQDYCLTREEPDKQPNFMSFGAKKDVTQWAEEQVVVHGQDNKVASCQVPSSSCHVGRFDVFGLFPDTGTNPSSVVMVYRPSTLTRVEETARLQLDSRGYFLYGEMGKDAARRSVYVFFRRVSECKFLSAGKPEITYKKQGAVDQCEVYRVEMYPVSDATWNKFKPDSVTSTWTKFNADCKESAELQPGGGGGHDPP